MHSEAAYDGPAAFVLLTRSALPLARRLQTALPAAEIHGLAGRLAEGEADILFADAAGHIRSLFAGGCAVIGLCAAGVLVRAVAPVLGDKRGEPPLLAVSEDGGAVVPLLGGHRGANALARRLAALGDGRAAITTAGDVRLGFALDAPPPGWTVAAPAQAKRVMAALLAGERVDLDRQAGDGGWPPAAAFTSTADAGDGPGGETAPGWTVRVTDRAAPAAPHTLVLHPPTLALGVGCARGADPRRLEEFVRAALAEAGLAPQSIAVIGSLDIKVDEPALKRLAAALDRPFRVFTAAELERQCDRLATPSATVFAETGCHGVAEGAALALAGPEAALLLPKRRTAEATLAVARAPRVDFPRAGRAPGRLFLVGVGPGDRRWRTAEARSALLRADLAVGYGPYLDLAADLLADKPARRFALGEEEARARFALDQAATGKSVALVCSGDPGVYALAAPLFEMLLRHDRRDWNGVDITVVPGISAFQAAAARLGAPFGHDFCLISLSDLLTPRPVILQRLRAAASGGFAVALYNPQSARRRTLLAEAQHILLESRPPETPLAIARNLGRPGEELTLTSLAAFRPETVDMLSLVLVGNRETLQGRRGGRALMVTPRGYGIGGSGGAAAEGKS